MIESVTLVRESDRNVGVATYAKSLGEALTAKGLRVSYFEHWKQDYYFAGRNLGAVAYPLISRARELPKSDLAHATFSNLASGKCQVTTVMDLIWKRSNGYAESKVLHKVFKTKIGRGVVVCPTRFVASEVAEWLGIDAGRIVVTLLAPGRDFYREHGQETEGFALLVGDANERKRTLEAVKAMEGLGLGLVHVGRPLLSTSYGQLCIEEAVKRGVPLIEHGPLATDALRRLMNRASLLLYPSTDEGFGLPPLEAAACGLTTVMGDHPVFREVMGEVGGYYANGANPIEIRGAIQQALKDPVSKTRLVRAAQAYSWEKCATETIAAYELALEGRQ